MNAVGKHFVTLAWFTGVAVVLFMVAFNYLKSAVEETKAEVVNTVNAPLEAFDDGFSSFASWTGSLNDSIDDAIKDKPFYDPMCEVLQGAQDGLNSLVDTILP